MKPFPGAGLPLLLALASAAVIAPAQYPGIVREYQTLVSALCVLAGVGVAWWNVQRQIRHSRDVAEWERPANLAAARVGLALALSEVMRLVEVHMELAAKGPEPHAERPGLGKDAVTSFREVARYSKPHNAEYVIMVLNELQVAIARTEYLKEEFFSRKIFDFRLRVFVQWACIRQMIARLFDLARHEAEGHLDLPDPDSILRTIHVHETLLTRDMRLHVEGLGEDGLRDLVESCLRSTRRLLAAQSRGSREGSRRTGARPALWSFPPGLGGLICAARA